MTVIETNTNYTIEYYEDTSYPYVWTSHKWMLKGANVTLDKAQEAVAMLDTHRYVTPREIYNSKVIRTNSDISDDFMIHFVPELNLLDFELVQDIPRLLFKRHNKYIISVWLDCTPFMICFNSPNQRKKIITDEVFYREMIGYIFSLRRLDELELSDIDTPNWYASMINDEFVDTLLCK